MAGIADKFTETFNSSNPTATTVSAPRIAGATSLSCANLSGWPTNTAVHFSTYKISTSGAKVAGSQIDWKGLVSGTTIGTLTRQGGATDAGNAIGDVVEMGPTAAWANDYAKGLEVQHNQDGTHGAITATSIVSAGGVTGTTLTGTSLVNTGDIQLRSTSLETIRTETFFDYVASGIVWTADSAGTTRNGSMTSGVVYIGGKRIAVSAVTANVFAASSDTYVDIDNTGVVNYTAVANNLASPALSANRIRVAIIVTGATNIAAATSVNQGQETMVLPIASSIPYAVTDSLGNLICPRDPQRRILGYRQSISTFTTASVTAVQFTAVSCPVIVPTGRKVRISCTVNASNTTAGDGSALTIWDGVVSAGTQLQINTETSAGANQGETLTAVALTTPATSSKTYNLGLHAITGGTAQVGASATQPVGMIVELI